MPWDPDWHQAIENGGLWQKELMEAIQKAEGAQDGMPLDHDQLDQIAKGLLDKFGEMMGK